MQLRSQTGYTLVLEDASDFVLVLLTCTCLVPLIGRTTDKPFHLVLV